MGKKKAKHMRPLLKKGATSPQGFSFLTKGFITINGNSFGVWSQPHYSSIGILPRPCYNLTNFYIDKKFKITARKSAIWFRYSFSPVMGSLLNNLRLRRPGLEWDNLRPNHQEFQYYPKKNLRWLKLRRYIFSISAHL